MGKLSIVATPIGNMGDITLRAIETLKAAEVIFCEDTRVAGKLLERLEIEKKELVRADAEKETAAAEYALECLEAGKQIAYVSDAGTPGVSDPGARLVHHVRSVGHRMSNTAGNLPEGFKIEAIPGASSVTAALSIAGINTDSFSFLGFVPHKKGRETFFKGLATYEHPAIFFESPHRILKTFESLNEHYPESTLYIGRELTKLHEEMLIGTPAEILGILSSNPVKQKGEFVIIFK